MRIKLFFLGRKDELWVEDGVDHYAKRIKRYCPFELRKVDLPDLGKKPTVAQHQQRETATMEAAIAKSEHVIVLDKQGKPHSSEDLAKLLAKLQSSSLKEVAFVIGGPYGFTPGFVKNAKSVISLSPMTFPHQLARLMLVEQLYRAFTILRGEGYHHS